MEEFIMPIYPTPEQKILLEENIKVDNFAMNFVEVTQHGPRAKLKKAGQELGSIPVLPGRDLPYPDIMNQPERNDPVSKNAQVNRVWNFMGMYCVAARELILGYVRHKDRAYNPSGLSQSEIFKLMKSVAADLQIKQKEKTAAEFKDYVNKFYTERNSPEE